MNSYQIRKAEKIDRLNARADRKAAEARATEATASRRADAIPFGQPLMPGHHSYKRDRNYREKIRNGFMKAAKLSQEAAELSRRASAAESNRAISSDDPDAPELLGERIAKLKAAHAKMVAFNKGLRAGKTDAELAALTGLTEGACKDLREPDFCGRVGFAAYQLSNSSANIKRHEKRAASLTAKAAAPTPEPETIGEVRIEESDNRVRCYFPGKPSEATRKMLKGRGFRWSPTEGAWQRHASTGAWWDAREVAKTLLPPAPFVPVFAEDEAKAAAE